VRGDDDVIAENGRRGLSFAIGQVYVAGDWVQLPFSWSVTRKQEDTHED
jgi:hypothetical protein